MLNYQSVLKHIAIVTCLGLIFTTGKVFAQDEAVEFSLKDLNGKIHKLSDYRGKWVVVNFWATWCPPCLDEIPELIEFHQAHQATTAVVLGINHEQPDLEYLKEFVDQAFVNYPVLLTQGDEKLPFGNLRGLPTTVLVSPQGVPVVKRTGVVTRQDLEQAIQSFSQK
ncbi:MAG: TlpA disulfide reductase family protein [Gammaproteobacteria bacterium]